MYPGGGPSQTADAHRGHTFDRQRRSDQFRRGSPGRHRARPWEPGAVRAHHGGDGADRRDELAARAARSGRSLQEYLRAELIDLADHPDPGVLARRIRDRKDRTGTVLPVAEILEYRDDDRR